MARVIRSPGQEADRGQESEEEAGTPGDLGTLRFGFQETQL